MKKYILFISTLFLFLSLSSCVRIGHAILLNKKIDKGLAVLYNEEEDKTVVFIPMSHIGYPEFYESVKYTIDTLRDAGYVAFLEGVNNGALDSLEIDTLNRKFRKILRVNVMGGYRNEDNKSLSRLTREGKKYVDQDYDYLGVGEKFGDEWSDLNKDTLIHLYEKEKGEIALDECDFETGLYEKYKCKKNVGKKERRESRRFLVHKLRDDHLKNRIIESDHKKIMVIYGKMHLTQFRFNLLDHGYKVVKYGSVW